MTIIHLYVDIARGHHTLLNCKPDPAEIIRQSFTSRLTLRVDAAAFEPLREMILAGDVQRLYEFDLEVASFYCPVCRASYCGDHWKRRDVFDEEEGFTWHDSIRGRCPSGHDRMLED